MLCGRMHCVVWYGRTYWRAVLRDTCRPIFVARDKTQDGDQRTKELMQFMLQEDQAPKLTQVVHALTMHEPNPGSGRTLVCLSLG